MKKVLTVVLITLLATSCLLAFVGCNPNSDNNDGDNNTGGEFVGAISQSTYSSVENAVKGFLEEEISGMMFTAMYVNYVKTDDLTQEEINALAIDEELKDGIVGVEKGEVEYIEQSNTELVTTLAAKTYKRIVYIISYAQNGTTKYRFYVYTEKVGETPSSSVWSSLFDVDNYINSTIKIECDAAFHEDGDVTYVSTLTFTEDGYCAKMECYVN